MNPAKQPGRLMEPGGQPSGERVGESQPVSASTEPNGPCEHFPVVLNRAAQSLSAQTPPCDFEDFWSSLDLKTWVNVDKQQALMIWQAAISSKVSNGIDAVCCFNAHDKDCPAYESVSAQTPPDVELISAKVHEQWMESKRAQGVRSRKSESGEELMVPYDQLSEAAKELDRGSVRAVLSAKEKV